jgi:hypothetical protein
MLLADITNLTAKTMAQNGIGIGTAIVVVCSWDRNRSILLAVCAGALSWLFVLYFALCERPEQRRWIGEGVARRAE